MNKYTNKAECLIIVRGAGDLATGVIYALWMAGYPVVALETAQPTAIRRAVALSEAVYDGMTTVEGMEGVLTDNLEKALQLAGAGKVQMLFWPKEILARGTIWRRSRSRWDRDLRPGARMQEQTWTWSLRQCGATTWEG